MMSGASCRSRTSDDAVARFLDFGGAARKGSPASPLLSVMTTTTRAHGRTLAAGLDERRNALNVIRLLLALLVIVDHSRPLGGFGREPRIGTATLGSLAVAGFFTLSGYLIASSRTRTSTAQFLWHRFLRIFPGYWVCLVVVAFGFGPLAWWHGHGSLVGYGAAQPLRYVAQNLPLLTPRVDVLPGTLATVPHARTWDTSLWTLQWELVCYLAIAALARFGLLSASRRVVVSWMLSLVVLLGAIDALVPGLPAGPAITLFVRFAAAFLAGTFLFLYADKVPLDGRLALAGIVAIAVLVHAPRPTGLVALPLAYVLLWTGARWRTSLFRSMDLSYGIYIYGFPVQQTLALHGAHHHGYPTYLVAGAACTLPFALASFLLIERPAMRARQHFGHSGRQIASTPTPAETIVHDAPDLGRFVAVSVQNHA
jgi:peptidoglycan/LPS O-acetylase OafA/YrhL